MMMVMMMMMTMMYAQNRCNAKQKTSQHLIVSAPNQLMTHPVRSYRFTLLTKPTNQPINQPVHITVFALSMYLYPSVMCDAMW